MNIDTESGVVSRADARGPLNADAARFLEHFRSALAFPSGVAGDPEATRRYLEGERSRLSSRLGTELLDDAERAVTTEDHTLIQGVQVRSYVPPGTPAQPRPVVLYIHGGGWVSGSIDLHDTTCRILAAKGDLVVVNVGYRLAPEHPYPTPLDDCDRALQWIRSVARSRFDADAGRLAVVGASSGGNLAAALALRARDRRTSELTLQVLLYPALDARTSGDSFAPEVNGRDYFITAEHMRWYWDQYRGDAEGLEDDPYFSPVDAEDLTGLPPAVIVSAEFDVLRDDAARYHERLLDAGVDSQRLHYQQIHGFLALFDTIADAYETVGSLAALIRTKLDDLEAQRLADGRPVSAPPAIDVTTRVEPGTLERLDRLTRWDCTSIDTIRATYAALPRPVADPDPTVIRTDAVIGGPDGTAEVPVRWYSPADAVGLLPGVVYLHGGAYIMGTLDENDDRLDQLVRELGCVVVSVDYRLAPEHPYPAGLDDTETVWQALIADPNKYGLDGRRLAIAGSSAGAGLATALCIRLGELGLAQPRFQLLVYPMLDDREWPSIAALKGGSGHWGLWHLRAERLAWAAYLGALAGAQDVPATAVPGRARPSELSGLPPAFIGVGDVDALLDSNVRYASSLIEAGVPTELHVYPGVIHGGFVPRPSTPGTSRFLRDGYDALRRALAL